MPLPTAASSAVAGQAIFSDICSTCHLDHGAGRIGVDLTLSFLPREEILDVIRTGRAGTQMAAFESVLTGTEIDAVAGYVASLRQGN